MSKWLQAEDDILISGYTNKSRDDLMGALPSRSWSSICARAVRLGFRRRRCLEIKECPSWLVGELLSDGHINPRGAYSHTTSQQDYVRFLAERFLGIGAKSRVHSYRRYDARYNKWYWQFSLRTRNYFPSLRDLWYPSGKKVIPTSIVFDVTALWHFLWGDGTVTSNGTEFKLYTTSFSDQEAWFLVAKIAALGLVAKYNEKSNYITIPKFRENQERVLGMLDWVVFPQCYKYKEVNLRAWCVQKVGPGTWDRSTGGTGGLRVTNRVEWNRIRRERRAERYLVRKRNVFKEVL